MPHPGSSAPSPVLSVVIPCRNAAEELAEQLEALAGQEWDQSWEVLVADNGSTDGTPGVVASFLDRLPGLRMVDASARPGQSFALEAGVRESSGSSLLFLDADDRVMPGYVAAMAAGLQDHEMVAARLDCRTLNPGWVGEVKEPSQEHGLGTPFGFLPAAAGCSLGIRRSLYEAIGGVSDLVEVGNDLDLSWRVQLAGYSLGFVPDAVLQYRYRSTLRGIFHQALGYGESGPLLYRNYRLAGMRRSSTRAVAREWGGTLRLVATATTAPNRGRAAAALGLRIGKVLGSVRHRVLYL